MQTYDGSCHCGRVRFRVTAALAPIVRCNCSICRKKGFLHLIVPPDRFELLAGREDLTLYEFNTKTAKHQFCRHCGIHPFYVPRSDPDKISVNVRCLEGVDPDGLTIDPFDGRTGSRRSAPRRGKSDEPVEVDRVEFRRRELDFTSSEQGKHMTTSVVADGTELINALDLIDSEGDPIQTSVCEQCGVSGCARMETTFPYGASMAG